MPLVDEVGRLDDLGQVVGRLPNPLQLFRQDVGGQSGKVAGERPWSKWKIAFAVLLALIVAGAFFYFTQKQ